MRVISDEETSLSGEDLQGDSQLRFHALEGDGYMLTDSVQDTSSESEIFLQA
jgi:hypothetical protein